MGEEKWFSKDLNKLMQFPKEGIFSTVLAKSSTYNYTLKAEEDLAILLCLTK